MSLTWIMFGLAVWLGVGALTAWLLFGASDSGSSYSRDEDDLEVANVRERPSATVGSRYTAPGVRCCQRRDAAYAVSWRRHNPAPPTGRRRRVLPKPGPPSRAAHHGCGLSRDVTTKSVRSLPQLEQRNRSGSAARRLAAHKARGGRRPPDGGMSCRTPARGRSGCAPRCAVWAGRAASRLAGRPAHQCATWRRRPRR